MSSTARSSNEGGIGLRMLRCGRTRLRTYLRSSLKPSNTGPNYWRGFPITTGSGVLVFGGKHSSGLHEYARGCADPSACPFPRIEIVCTSVRTGDGNPLLSSPFSSCRTGDCQSAQQRMLRVVGTSFDSHFWNSMVLRKQNEIFSIQKSS